MTMIMNESWQKILSEELSKTYIKELNNFISNDIKNGHEIYPSLQNVFSAFEYVSFEDVRVVIVGQDPYHGPNQAHGLCFSVNKSVRIPRSLKNIFKELVNDVGIEYPEHGYLINWANQGVLLLNSILTVRKSTPMSHKGIGWEMFTDAIIKKLCKRDDPMVFLLWGKAAQGKCNRIFDKEDHNHLVLKASHPSPLSAKGFLGCRHFSKTNNFLKKPIDWRVL